MKIEYITRNEDTNIVTIRISNPTRTYTIPSEMADDLAFQLLRAKYHKDVIIHFREHNYDPAICSDTQLCNDIASIYTKLRMCGDMTWDEALTVACSYEKERIAKYAANNPPNE